MHQSLSKIFCKFLYSQNFLQRDNIRDYRVTSENMDLFMEQKKTCCYYFLKQYVLYNSIDEFGVSVATLLGGENSGQMSIKCCDLAYDVEPPLLKNCKYLTMKLEFKHLFPTSSSGVSFYIYQLPEDLGMTKY